MERKTFQQAALLPLIPFQSGDNLIILNSPYGNNFQSTNLVKSRYLGCLLSMRALDFADTAGDRKLYQNFYSSEIHLSSIFQTTSRN